MDYEELVKFLRSELCVPYTTMKTMHEAADAIEELQAAVEREKTYTQFWEYAAKTYKEQYEKMEKKMLDWKATAEDWRDAYYHWFENYQNDVPKWIPVTERLPEENVCVLVWGGYFAKVMETAILDDGLFYSAWDNRTEMFGVTRWMPLPTPPKEETE